MRAPETSERLLEMSSMELSPALLQGDTREQWEAISDLDAFLSRVYTYFQERGLRCILASRVISLLTLFFTLALTVFLGEFVNWHGLLFECDSDERCAAVPLVRPDALRHPANFLVLFSAVFSLYLLWMVAHFLWDLRPLLEMRSFFHDKLHICDEDLQAATWDDVVQALVELQRTSRLCIVKDQLTAHDIANRVLRKENYMVAFVNKGLLPIMRIPCIPALNTCTKTLEWNLYVVVLDAMFDKEFRIRQSFTHDIFGLRRRLFLCVRC